MRRRVSRLVVSGTRPSVVDRIKKRKDNFLATTSITVEEFEEMYKVVEPEAAKQHNKQHKQRKIERKYGAGRAHLLPLQDRACACLMVLKGLKKRTVATIFDVSHDTINKAYNELMPVLAKCLKTPQAIFWHVTHAEENEDLRKWMDPRQVAFDGTVVNTTKPPDKKTLLVYARRGKGVGFNVMTGADGTGIVVWLSKAVPASWNDAKTYKKTRNAKFMARFTVAYSDRGLNGAEKDERVNHVHGIKRRPGGELSEEDRKINSWINSRKYRVEQTNSFIKNFGILDNLSWRDREKLDEMLQVICGVINFRTEYRRRHPVDWGHKNRPHHERVQKPKGFTIAKHIKRLRGKKSPKNASTSSNAAQN